MKLFRFISYVIFAVVLAFPGNVFGQHNYYISSLHGNDANNGTSPATPWKSLSKLEGVLPILSSGDVVHFERGSIWHETNLTLKNRNGSESGPIVFTAYGSGPRPILSGSKVIEEFSKSGNIYSASVYKDFAQEALNAPTGILINGSWRDIARSEESLVLGSWSDTQITDPSKNWEAGRYTGALALVQPVHWHWTPTPITGNTSNTLYFKQMQHRSSGDKIVAFYIANHDDFLKANGDWTFRNRTLKVFYDKDLNQENVQFAVSDSLFSVMFCNNVEFRDIVFEMANFRHLVVRKSDNVKIIGCEFRYTAGGAVKFYDTGDLVFTDNYVHDCGAVGLRLTYFGYAEVRRNLFRRISTQQIGVANYDFRMGAAITLNYCKEPYYQVEYNYFDSVGLAIQSHTFRSDGSASLSYNYIENYGISISDCGAFYFNSDYGSDVKRNVKNNIIRNARSAGTRYPDNYHPVLHPHAIYIDEGALGYRCDSNTIENSTYAVYMNRSYKSSFLHGNVVNANQNNPDFYNAIFMKDQAIGTFSGSADKDSIMFNNIVLEGVSPKVYIRHTGDEALDANIDENKFYYDYNKIANPFNAQDPYIGRYIFQWGNGADYNYTLDQMRADGGMVSSIPTDMHSVINPQSISYSSVSSLVSKEDFVKLYTNYSASSRTVNLGNVTFRDIDGQTITGSIVIPPFYSKILFYQSGNLGTTDAEHYIDSTLVPALVMDENGFVNSAPVLSNTEFVIHEVDPLPMVVGVMDVFDPDDTQGHSFSITADNSNGLFEITNSGRISFTTSNVSFEGNPVYQLTVRVRDNGTPPLSAEAQVTIRLMHSATNQAPFIEDQVFEYYGGTNATSLVGSVIAYDPDGDDVSYEISAGDQEYFTLNAITGELFMDDIDLQISSPTSFELKIRVTDSGSPSLSDEASILVVYIPVNYTIFIDPDVSDGGDGSYLNPFNSFDDIVFEPDYSYLVKKNSELWVDQLQINSDNVVIGSYGEGAAPVLRSYSSDPVIRSIDRQNVTIRDLRIKANNALSAIYFVGPGSENILISNCIIEGAEYGLRFINTGKTVTRYCKFFDNQCAVYSIGSGSSFFYNVFSGNQYGLDISVHTNSVNVFNNVFYNNRQAIHYSGLQFNMNNNILFLKEEDDKAVEITGGTLQSDHNIYFPERDGFFKIDNLAYNTLSDLNEFENIDLNSMVTDPCFLKPEEANFLLAGHSPAIDAGIYVGLQHDINGIPIPIGNAPDIGIMEYFDSQVGIEDTTVDEMEASFWSYPNPASDLLFIKSNMEFNGNESILLYTPFGRLISTTKVSAHSVDRTKCYLDVSALDPGVYLVTVSGETLLGTVKFIKGE